MKKRKILKVGIIILITLLVLGLIIFFRLFIYPKLRFAKLKYDILIKEHYNNVAESGDNFETGAFLVTSYTVLNSEKREKYTLTYHDVLYNGVDYIRIKIEKISEEELQDAIKKYGKDDEKFKLKDLFEQNVEEEYRVYPIERK